MPLQPEPHFPPPGRPPSARPDLVLLRDPVLVTQGTEYLLVSWALGELTARLVPGARLSLNQGIGHQPFVESPERFNRELAEFVVGVGAVRLLWRLTALSCMDGRCVARGILTFGARFGCGHVSGLLTRYSGPLALMTFAGPDPYHRIALSCA